jgi:hypothetical protein
MQHDRNTHPKDSPVTATVICRQHLPAHAVAAITRAMRNLVASRHKQRPRAARCAMLVRARCSLVAPTGADGADHHAAGRVR